MLDALLKSNIIGVLVGGLIALTSVHSIEFFKLWKETRADKRKIYYQLAAKFNMFKRYAVLAAQMDLLNDYHKCRKQIYAKEGNPNDSQYHDKEAKRRLLQFEEFQTKRIEIEGKLFLEIAKYYLHVGKDAYLDRIVNEIEDWEHPRFSSDFESINDMENCEAALNDGDQKINSIDDHLKKLREQCLKQIKGKLNI
jgi:hypothetical protein